MKGAAAILVALPALAWAASPPPVAEDGAALAHKHACDACHAPRDPGTGPSWAEIAAKYRGKTKAAGIVATVVKKGRHGSGPWPMPPLPQVTEAEARKIADYVLAVRP